MNQSIKRRDALKTMVAFGGLLLAQGVAPAQFTLSDKNRKARTRLASAWSYLNQPCAIYGAGKMLLLINEVGSVGSAVWSGPQTITVLAGAGWDAGLTGQFSTDFQTINWSNNTIWTVGFNPPDPISLDGGWIYSGQPCAVLQQDKLLIFINEVGSIGTGIWTVNKSLTILGGGGWDLGLTATVADAGHTLNWSNGTVWTRV